MKPGKATPEPPKNGKGRTEPDVRTLLIGASLWADVVRTCADDGLEHGGKAMGRLFLDGVAVACKHIGPGPLAESGPAHFRPDIAYQQTAYNDLVRRHPGLRLVLDYHLHPAGPRALSHVDLEAAQRILSPGGWGLSRLSFMILSFDHGRLQPSVYHAVRRPGGGLRILEVSTAVVPDTHPRIQQVLEAAPERMTVVVGEEVVAELLERAATRSSGQDDVDPPEGVLLHGYQRMEEGMIQVLSLERMIDTYPVGRAFVVPDVEEAGFVNGLPALAERELRLLVGAGGRVRGTFATGPGLVPCTVEQFPVRDRIHIRNEGLAPQDALAKQHVVFVGVGSVGAPVAVLLAASGLGRFTLVDPDRFSPPNVARHTGDVRDVGRLKVAVVRDHLKARNPSATVACLPVDVRDEEALSDVRRRCEEADLVIVTTDDPTANLAMNRVLVEEDLAGLFAGVFDGGIGGEVFARTPDSPVCYNCVAGFRRHLPPIPRSERAHDYVDLRPGADFPPMHALGIDIAHTTSVVASIALGLLGAEGRLEDLELASPDTRLLFVANGRTGWIFSRPFEVISARLDAVGCPVCAPQRCRIPALWTLGTATSCLPTEAIDGEVEAEEDGIEEVEAEEDGIEEVEIGEDGIEEVEIEEVEIEEVEIEEDETLGAEDADWDGSRWAEAGVEPRLAEASSPRIARDLYLEKEDGTE